uniref:NB-ARC domain-containing protein n=1 Tax=Fagus sylvatica TaxID=28930 RepID=A0A2N9F8U5_FAGSY
MVDAIVSNLLKQLVSITAQQAKEEIKLIVGVDEEVQELKHKLRIIQAMLDNEEERQLKQHVENHWQPEVVPVDRPKTTSFVDASNIIGRDNNKANLLSSLLDKGSQEERKPRVISLVGMGGLGKTTLAQLAYNDPKVKAHFEQRMWMMCGPKTPQSGIPFKLVFENGAQDSRVLVTTRKLGVAKMMASAPINLEVLSEEDCWLIFSKIAFSNEDQRKDLEDLGRQLAIKCKGLPLAVKTLDDVWTEDSTKWEPFKLVFENGAQDSRVLVTTRKLGVAKMMASAPINLELPSSTMADAIVYDLLKQLASITTQQAKEEIKLIVGVDEEVQELKHKLRIIQADAGRMRRKDKLKQHVLRTIEIEKEEDINAAPAVKKKVLCSFFPSLSYCFRHIKNLALRHDIGHKIKKLNETLDKIAKGRLLPGFDLTMQLEAVERPKTTSFVDATNIIGRDNNKANLLSSLLDKGSQEERKPRVISLVGMGGLGKTTLAQLAYNDPEVKAHFEQRMWVCVSDPFDQCRVAKAIIQEIDPKSPQ